MIEKDMIMKGIRVVAGWVVFKSTGRRVLLSGLCDGVYMLCVINWVMSYTNTGGVL